jgi:hypothetical protein
MRKIFQLLQLKFRGYIIIDNFFPEKAAAKLRDIALSEQFVNLHYTEGGYKASDFDNGSDIKMDYRYIQSIMNKLPILKGTKYIRSWSFVYDTICEGVHPHADPSKFNCNVWVTPDSCVFDNKKNGLILFKKHANPNWTHYQYNANGDFISGYLYGSRYVKIPYKFNRAVIFPGKVFHATAEVHMKSGEENRRINYTFLFE